MTALASSIDAGSWPAIRQPCKRAVLSSKWRVNICVLQKAVQKGRSLSLQAANSSSRHVLSVGNSSKSRVDRL
jgi:hypothetical protein